LGAALCSLGETEPLPPPLLAKALPKSGNAHSQYIAISELCRGQAHRTRTRASVPGHARYLIATCATANVQLMEYIVEDLLPVVK